MQIHSLSIIKKKYHWCKKNDKQSYNKKELCPHLKFGNCMENIKVKKYQLVEALLYRLKMGCKWHELPIKQLFKTVYK